MPLQLTLSQSDLARATAIAAKAVAPRSPMPLLENLYISANGSISITGGDGGVSITTETRGTVQSEGSILLPAKEAAQLFKSLPRGDVSIRVEGAQIDINAAGSSYQFMFDPEEPKNYPMPSAQKEGGVTAKLDSRIIQAIKNASSVASTDEFRPAMCGVLLSLRSIATTVVATDGFRLVRYVLNGVDVKGEGVQVILPPATIRALATMEEPTVTITEDSIVATEHETTIRSRTIGETYPNWSTVIPPEEPTDTVWSARRDDLLTTLRRISVATNETHSVVFDVNNDTLSLRVNDGASSRSATERLTVESSAEITSAFNRNFFEHALSMFSGEVVTIRQSTPPRPALITSDNDEGLLSLLMPIRHRG